MQNFSSTVKIFGVAVLINLIGVASPAVWAESAPVYDADAVQQQFDNSVEQTQDLPPPPPPGQEGAYVPSQQAPVSAPNMPPLSMEQRVKRVEQQINNMQNSDSAARADALQNQVQSLRGQVEQLTRQLEQLQAQQKTMYVDLDKRLTQQSSHNKQLANAVAANAADDTDDLATSTKSAAKVAHKTINNAAKVADDATVKSADDQPNVAEEQEIYQTAYNLIKAKKYSDAAAALQKMLQKYPSGQFAANAHYWLGELYGLMSKNDQALTEFGTVVKTYPDSPRVSDAQLKIGLIYATQLKWPDAKTAFKKVINHYPGTASARLASEQLKQIKQAGH